MTSSFYEISACRGVKAGCQFSLVDEPDMLEGIERVTRDSAWVTALPGRYVHHKRLKIALAACPNACSQPQIKDVGVVAVCVPKEIGANCTGCGQCEDLCREDAIAVKDGLAKLQPQRCVGCGMCIEACPQKVIESGGVRFRILVGGTMGRHPRWAQELCVVDASHVAGEVARFLDAISRRAEEGEKIASVVERIGLPG
jgi:dissimilatory sulfite reductase (desulfoviridin) alpha/beta subunit